MCISIYCKHTPNIHPIYIQYIANISSIYYKYTKILINASHTIHIGMAALSHTIVKLELMPHTPRRRLPHELSRKNADNAFGVNPCAILYRKPSIEISRRTGKGAKINDRNASNSIILTSRKNRVHDLFYSKHKAWHDAARKFVIL